MEDIIIFIVIAALSSLFRNLGKEKEAKNKKTVIISGKTGGFFENFKGEIEKEIKKASNELEKYKDIQGKGKEQNNYSENDRINNSNINRKTLGKNVRVNPRVPTMEDSKPYASIGDTVYAPIGSKVYTQTKDTKYTPIRDTAYTPIGGTLYAPTAEKKLKNEPIVSDVKEKDFLSEGIVKPESLSSEISFDKGFLNLDEQRVLEGVIWSEILNKPLCKRGR